MIYKINNNSPKIDKNCFVAPSADIIGNVEIAENSSVWFGSSIRADLNAIKIGKNVSVQDGCVLHTDDECPVVIGDNVAIGHKAVIHSAKIGSNCLIGMNAVILSGAKIGNNCIVGAGSVVTEGTFIQDNSVVMGVPGKAVKEVTPVHLERIKKTVEEYVRLNKMYLDSGIANK